MNDKIDYVLWDKCLEKAKEAFELGIIEFDKIEEYAEHLYKEHNRKS